MLITLTARIFSGSHTKESHARMRNKTDNPLPETAQAPPASSEPAAPAPPTFHPRDWVPLRDAVLQIISLAGEDRVLGLAIVNRDLRNGLLEGALVAPDGTMTLFSRTDWEHRTVHAPHNPAEGVGVAPYEPGRYFVSRASFAKLTSPATPATAADRQPYAAGGSEPSQSPQAEHEAAAAPTSNAEVGPQHQQTEPEDLPAPEVPARPVAVASEAPPAPEMSQQEWWDAFLTLEKQTEFETYRGGITAASRATHSLMDQARIVGGAYKLRYIEKLLRKTKLFPPVRRRPRRI